MSLADLEVQARRFAAEVSDLLNRTITDGVRVSAVLTPGGSCLVGRGISRSNFRPLPVPVTLGRRSARCWLRVAHTFQLDPEGVYLAAAKTDYSVYLNEPCSEMLFHYDYDRDPANEYPQAHFQINADAAHFATLCDRAEIAFKELKDFHFPVGGRRFRPALDDVVEFLILEELAEARPGWREVIEEHRSTWYRRQLLAAVRRDEEAVRGYLASVDRERGQ